MTQTRKHMAPRRPRTARAQNAPLAQDSLPAIEDAIVQASAADPDVECGKSLARWFPKSAAPSSCCDSTEAGPSDIVIVEEDESSASTTGACDASRASGHCDVRSAPEDKSVASTTFDEDALAISDECDARGAASLTTNAMMKAVIGGSSSALFAKINGGEDVLTAGNVAKLQKTLFKAAHEAVNAPRRPSDDLKSDDEIGKNDKKIRAALEQVLATGKFDPRSGYGNKFRTALNNDADQKRLYDNMSKDAARDFRLNWAKTTLDSIVKKKTTTTEWSKSDKDKYRYRTFGAMVKDFGGWRDQSAIDGASRAAMKCILMGPPWVDTHPQSEMATFAILDKSWEEVFSQRWSETREEWSNAVGSGRPAAPSAPRPAAPSAPQPAIAAAAAKVDATCDEEAPAAKKRRTKGDKGQLEPSEVVLPGESAKGDKKEVAKKLRDATKFKVDFASACHKALELLQCIEKEEAWSWARGDKMPKLKVLVSNLKKELTPWGSAFMMESDMSKLRKQNTTDKLNAELDSLLALQQRVKEVTQFTDKLLNAQAMLS